jgi:hypothetical protein
MTKKTFVESHTFDKRVTFIESVPTMRPVYTPPSLLQVTSLDVSNGGLGISAEGNKIFVWEADTGKLRVSPILICVFLFKK